MPPSPWCAGAEPRVLRRGLTLLQVYSPVYVASVQQKLPKPKPLDMFNDPDKYQARTERLSVKGANSSTPVLCTGGGW